MPDNIYQIYDNIFKRIFSLSSLAIINLINGLFKTNHPPDSSLSIANREFITSTLEKRFADVIITVNDIPYHLEAQMYLDGSIVVRAFEYGFQYAIITRTDNSILHFPEPIIIYLDTNMDVPETSELILDFGSQGTFPYTVKNFIYQKHDIVELNQKKMITLIPFLLLKLRKIIAKDPSKENFQLLHDLLQNDILDSIRANLSVGNITLDDANQLRELTLELYKHIYNNYESLGGYDVMKPLLEGAMELPLDKYRIRIDELEQELAATEQEKAAAMQEKAAAVQEKAAAEQRIAELETELRRLKGLDITP